MPTVLLWGLFTPWKLLIFNKEVKFWNSKIWTGKIQAAGSQDLPSLYCYRVTTHRMTFYSKCRQRTPKCKATAKRRNHFSSCFPIFFFFPHEFIQVSLISDMWNPKLISIRRWTHACPNFVKTLQGKSGSSQPGQVESEQPWAVLASHNPSPVLAGTSGPSQAKPRIVGSWQEL